MEINTSIKVLTKMNEGGLYTTNLSIVSVLNRKEALTFPAVYRKLLNSQC